jgi:hypothetical protein
MDAQARLQDAPNTFGWHASVVPRSAAGSYITLVWSSEPHDVYVQSQCTNMPVVELLRPVERCSRGLIYRIADRPYLV